MSYLFKYKIIFFITVFAITSIKGQDHYLFSEEHKAIRNVRNSLDNEDLSKPLERITAIHQKLIDTDNLQNPNVFGNYMAAVKVKIRIYKKRKEFLKLYEFQYLEAERIKPYKKYSDQHSDYYFRQKIDAADNYIEAMDESFESKKKSTQRLTALKNEFKRTYFDDKELQNNLQEYIYFQYFANKLSMVNAMKTETVEDLQKVKMRLNGLLGELKITKEFEEKDSAIERIKSLIGLNKILLNQKMLQNGEFQSYVKESNNSRIAPNTERNIDFFEKQFTNNLNLYTTGMLKTQINKQTRLQEVIKNYGFDESDPEKYNKLSYQIYKFNFYNYLALRDYDNALKSINEANVYYPKLSKLVQKEVENHSYYSNLSMLYSSQNKFELALEYSLKAIEDKVTDDSFDYITVAEIYYKLNDFEKAVEWQLKYLKFLNESKSGEYNYMFSLAYFQLSVYLAANKQYSEAKKYLDLTQMEEKEGYFKIYNLYKLAESAFVNFHRKDFNEADNDMLAFAKKFELPYFELLLGLDEETRELSYKNEKYNPDLLFYFLSKRKDPSKPLVGFGYNYALMTKQLLLNTSNTIRNNASLDKIPELRDINSKWTKVKEELKKINVTNRDSLMDLSRVYEKELVLRGKNSILESYNRSRVDWKDVKNSLKQKDVAIEFVNFMPSEVNRKESYYGAFVLRKDLEFPIYINLFEESQLNDLISPIVKKNNHPASVIKDLYEVNGNKIYNLIWKQLETHLQGVEDVYFSPTGIIHNVALAALPNNDNMFLGEKFILHQLTSTKEVISYNEISSIESSILFGDITYEIDKLNNSTMSNSGLRSGDFDYLTGTKNEIENINEILISNSINTLTYENDKATESNFISALTSKPSIMHIATHAFYLKPLTDEYFMTNMLGFAKFQEDNDPMNRSGLAMSGANYFWRNGENIGDNLEDGILTANELSNLNMNDVELIVMSACETGLGESNANEGVFGIQRGLKMAGVDNMLVSLWKVDDKITSEYMVSFYENLVQNEMSISDSYLATQETFKKKYKNPYYWAAFVLIK
ncbi:CHAT domain-containing protein [Maribacter sp. Hel_I_7]|uniref:CHAT domain-containing protein n=1 Tax=Maribacter sp. Hel_I_7 TaxID=1249997 RepID=UPI00047C9C5D|nr:CHAT domain-containing protein [Maribacter sp. Hel_I_7]